MTCHTRLTVVLSAIILFIGLGGFIFSTSVRIDVRRHLNYYNPPHRHHDFRAPKRNIWADLIEEEANEVYAFLLQEWAHLNVTRTPKSALETYIYTVESLQTNKTDILPYLYSNNTTTAAPERWAKVCLSRATELAYYAVGPLPITAGTTKVLPLQYLFNSGRNNVSNLAADIEGAQELVISIAKEVADVTQELLGGARFNPENPDGPDSLQAWVGLQRLQAGGLVLWLQFFRLGMRSSCPTLLPQGLYAKISGGGHVASGWTVGEWFYNGELYDDIDHLRAEMQKPGFLKTPANLDGPWTDTEDFDAQPDGRELPPPVPIQPYGPRYKFDRQERYVSWFGFTFYFSTTLATGVSLHDVRFKGERVMYELSLQEALAHYAGSDPMSGSRVFLDTFFGMGTNAFELVPGYDCPLYADYISSLIHRIGKTEKLANNICIFEFTADSLLSRHTAQYSVTVSRNTFLTLRFVSTVGNYDYTVDYIFYLDGTIEVKVRASGYIFGAFYANNPNKTQGEYGHRVHDALSTSMHDHVINFKADMDIAGSANEMIRLAIEPTTETYPWDHPETKHRNTMHLKEYPVVQETGLDWPKNAGEFYIVYSADKRNAWGQRRGYRIVPGTGVGNPPHLTILNSTSLGRSALWAERDLWVVRRKDHEPRAADPLNYLDAFDPLVDFGRIADGESLEYGGDVQDGCDGDLVVYFNIGSHHVPHSGDIPNTLMHTSSSSVMFIPHNFADRDPSRESVQGVRIQLRGKKSGGFAGVPNDGTKSGGKGQDLRARTGSHYKIHEGTNYFGTRYSEGVQLPLEALEPDLKKEYNSDDIRVSDLASMGALLGCGPRCREESQA